MPLDRGRWLIRPLKVLIADDEPLAAERLQLLLAQGRRRRPRRHRERRRERGQPGRGAEPRPAAARHRHAGPRRHRRRPRARRARSPSPAVVFVTAFDQFAVAAFEVEAVDYLMKPVDPARLQRALDRARDLSRAARDRAGRATGQASQWLEEFWASDLSGLVRIASRDVDRVSAERDYMRLHVGRRSWLIHHSMAALEEGLDPELFVRLHRSAIVRKDFITGFTRNPSGRWIARLADGDGAAGRPALFGPGAGDRRPLGKLAAGADGRDDASAAAPTNCGNSDQGSSPWRSPFVATRRCVLGDVRRSCRPRRRQFRTGKSRVAAG